MHRGTSGTARLPRVTVLVEGAGGRGLYTTLRSAVGQTLTDQQIFVCALGPTAAAEASRAARGDPRVVVVARRPDETPAGLRNRCLARARGLLVAFLREGDRWAPRKLQYQGSWMRRHPEYALTFTGCRGPWGSSDSSRAGGSTEGGGAGLHDTSLRSLAQGAAMPLSCAMVRRSALRVVGGRGGFDESPRLRGASDFDLWLRIAARGFACRRLDEALVWIGPGARPAFRERLRRIQKRGSALRRIRRLHREMPREQHRAMRDGLARTMRNVGALCLGQRLARRSRPFLRRSIRVSPLQFRGYALLLLSFLNPGISRRILRRGSPAPQKNG